MTQEVMAQEVMARACDLRPCGFCIPGARDFFDAHGLDWRAFVRGPGVPAAALEATGDHKGRQVAEAARARVLEANTIGLHRRDAQVRAAAFKLLDHVVERALDLVHSVPDAGRLVPGCWCSAAGAGRPGDRSASRSQTRGRRLRERRPRSDQLAGLVISSEEASSRSSTLGSLATSTLVLPSSLAMCSASAALIFFTSSTP